MGVRVAEHPCRPRGCLRLARRPRPGPRLQRLRTGAPSRPICVSPPLRRAGCGWQGGGWSGAARRLAVRPAAQAQERTVPPAAGHRLRSRVGPRSVCARPGLGPAPASERRRCCRLGRSQGHEEAAAATAARVKVTGRDCGGGGGGGSESGR